MRYDEALHVASPRLKRPPAASLPLATCQLKLPEICVQRAEGKVQHAQQELAQLRQHHADQWERRQRRVQARQRLEEEAEARKAMDEKRHLAATRIQAVYRGFMTKHVLVDIMEYWAARDLKRKHTEMANMLLSLRQSVHDLAHDDTDRTQAILRLQAWWRMILGKRLANMCKIHRKLEVVKAVLVFAATIIQSAYRMYRGRMRFKTLRKEKQMREMRVQKEHDARMAKHATRIQSGVRGMLARKEVRRRRAARKEEKSEENVRHDPRNRATKDVRNILNHRGGNKPGTSPVAKAPSDTNARHRRVSNSRQSRIEAKPKIPFSPGKGKLEP